MKVSVFVKNSGEFHRISTGNYIEINGNYCLKMRQKRLKTRVCKGEVPSRKCGVKK